MPGLTLAMVCDRGMAGQLGAVGFQDGEDFCDGGLKAAGPLVMLRRVKPGRGFDDLAAGEVFDDTCECESEMRGQDEKRERKDNRHRQSGSGTHGRTYLRREIHDHQDPCPSRPCRAVHGVTETPVAEVEEQGECGGQRGRWKTGEDGRRGFRCL
nr:unnamed protein product [Digitaria exilis]